jgi:selenocysteine lyase/cysteine desulfurase
MESQSSLVYLDKDIHYLNCAAKSPLLKSGERAMVEAMEREKQLHLRNSDDFFERPEHVRKLFANLVECRPSQVAFMPAVSYGLSSVLNNITPGRGQHAITVTSEFPSDYLGIRAWCDKHDSELKVVGSDQSLDLMGSDWNARILEAISEDTAVVVLSAIHWMHGMRFDLKQIGARCREVGAVFLVDGTQAVGAMSMNVHEFQIDALFCAGYKWLFGPYSLGCMYIGERFNDGKPIEESWMNRTNSRNFASLTNYGMEYMPDAGRYNVGETSHFLLMPMLSAGLEQVTAWGPDEIQAYCAALNKPLYDLLDEKGWPRVEEAYCSHHLFGLKMPDGISIDAMKSKLEEKNVYVSQRGESLRVSVHAFNTEADIEALMDALNSDT